MLSVARYEHAVPLFTDADILPLIFFNTNPLFNLMHDTTKSKSTKKRYSSSNNFYVKKSCLEIQKRAFSRAGAKIWNEIPASLRERQKTNT